MVKISYYYNKQELNEKVQQKAGILSFDLAVRVFLSGSLEFLAVKQV